MKYLNALVLFCCIFLFSAVSFAQIVHVVEVRNFSFVPESLSIAVNDTVEWQWIEGSHTTTSDSTTGQNVWNAPIDASNQIFRFVITTSGNHDYYCIPHQSLGMVGTIIATPATSIEDGTNQLEKFRLSQNYPNPFNPTTTIRYQLPERTEVSLKIFDITGHEVRTLVRERVVAGEHSVTWNGTNNQGNPVSSGVYLYQLKAGNRTESRRMLLLK
jgi:plastocyanin